MRDDGIGQKSCGMNPHGEAEFDQWLNCLVRVNGINFGVAVIIENGRKKITKAICSNTIAHSRESSEFNPRTREPAQHCGIHKNSRAAQTPANRPDQEVRV
jgi:hypothetical protein